MSKLEQSILSNDDALWFGGALSSGGSLRLDIWSAIRGEKRYTYAYPTLQLTDSDEKAIKTLSELYKGRVHKSVKEASWAWFARRSDVPSIAYQIKPYVPARRKMITAIEQWVEADKEERVRMAKEAQCTMDISLNPSEYTALILNPYYIAGILDTHTFIGVHDRKRNLRPLLRVCTKNKPLLEAMGEHYRGSINIDRSPNGDRSYYCQFYGTAAINLIGLASPYMKLK